MTIPGYVPAANERDPEKLARAIRHLFEFGADAADLVIPYFFHDAANALTAGATRFYVTGDSSTSRTDVQVPLPRAYTVRNLKVFTSAVPGAGQSYTCVVFNNGTQTSVTCTISDTAGTASDTTNTASFAADNNISLRVIASAGAATGRIKASVELHPA